MGPTSVHKLGDCLKGVLRRLPSPVGIITTYGSDRAPVGAAISAMMPVTLAPCAIAVCIDRSGSVHEALVQAGRFCINLLDPDQTEWFEPFANADLRDSRFLQADWRQRDAVWFVEGAPANIFCTIANVTPFGTHDLIIGAVDHLQAADCGEIVGWANGQVGRLVPLSQVSA